MSIASLHIPVPVTLKQKARISKMAKEAGLTIGEFMRRAADSHVSREDEELLEGLIRQLNKSTAKTIATVDQAIAVIDASHRRIDAMLAGKHVKTTRAAAARKSA
jgi:hypothetical protein